MRKRIKGMGKVLASVALSIVMMLGFVPVSVYAIETESLDNMVDDDGNPIAQVSGADKTGHFKIFLANAGDTIQVYKIASVTWDADKGEYKDPEWVPEVVAWIGNNATYKGKATYASPKALSTASVTVWENFYADLLHEEGNVITSLKDVDNGITDPLLKHVTDSSTSRIVVSAENAASNGLTQVTVVTDTDTNVDYIKLGAGNYTTTNGDAVNESELITKLNGLSTATKYADSQGRLFSVGDTLIDAVLQADVTGLEFGLYVVVGDNSADTINYDPVTVDLTPYQQGPVNSWFIRENITRSLKAGEIVLDKKINNKERDTVAVGDKVEFSIIFGCPSYQDRVTLSGTYSTVKDYTMVVDDIMSDSYSYVPGTVRIQYRENNTSPWKNINDASLRTSYKDVTYNAFANTSYFQTGSNTSIPQNKVTNGNLATVANTSAPYNTALVDQYYIPQTADVYTAQIASRATTAGGLGVSVFACETLSHKDDFQLFLFRYEDQENLNYWYYFRNGAYNLLRIDDTKNKRYTTALSNVDTTVTGGAVKATGATSISETISVADKSTYLNNLRIFYQQRTGDKVNHSVKWYPDWSVNVFNVTFNVGALNKWMRSNEIGSISEMRILYDAIVTEKVEVASEKNTNTAKFLYELDNLGLSTAKAEDTVYGYTYGINVVKVDGASYGTSEEFYLEGVEFALYKETDTFLRKANAVTDGNDPSGKGIATWQANQSMIDNVVYEPGKTKEEDQDNKREQLNKDYNVYFSNLLEEIKEMYAENSEVTVTSNKEDLKTLSAYQSYLKGNTVNADYYYYTEVAKSNGVTDSGVIYEAGDEIIRVFKKYAIDYSVGGKVYFTGNFVSTNTADGFLLSGVDVGNYVLVETKKRPDYNELAEDILFNIKRLPDETAELTYSGSLKVFLDGKDVPVESGIYKMDVLNYKGLQLPSTGGMGTKLFTIVGIAIMAAMMILLIIRKRKSMK